MNGKLNIERFVADHSAETIITFIYHWQEIREHTPLSSYDYDLLLNSFFMYYLQIFCPPQQLRVLKHENFCKKSLMSCWTLSRPPMIAMRRSWIFIIPRIWNVYWIWRYRIRRWHCSSWLRIVLRHWNIRWKLVS